MMINQVIPTPIHSSIKFRWKWNHLDDSLPEDTFGPFSEEKVFNLNKYHNYMHDYKSCYFDNGFSIIIVKKTKSIDYYFNSKLVTKEEFNKELKNNQKASWKVEFPYTIGKYNKTKLKNKDGIIFFDDGIFVFMIKKEKTNYTYVFDVHNQTCTFFEKGKTYNDIDYSDSKRRFYAKKHFVEHCNSIIDDQISNNPYVVEIRDDRFIVDLKSKFFIEEENKNTEYFFVYNNIAKITNPLGFLSEDFVKCAVSDKKYNIYDSYCAGNKYHYYVFDDGIYYDKGKWYKDYEEIDPKTINKKPNDVNFTISLGKFSKERVDELFSQYKDVSCIMFDDGIFAIKDGVFEEIYQEDKLCIIDIHNQEITNYYTGKNKIVTARHRLNKDKFYKIYRIIMNSLIMDTPESPQYIEKIMNNHEYYRPGITKFINLFKNNTSKSQKAPNE